ncbi:MAG: SBBP repeat-containing protein, partial [Blastocatellia bacterium]
VDPSGYIYVAGNTDAVDFPISPGAFQTNLHNSSAAFVMKLSPQASQLIYSTYIEGQAQSNAINLALGIAADSAGCAYVGGETEAADFPTTPGAFQSTIAGGLDDFVLKLNPMGTGMIYSTLIGGSNTDFCDGIAIDVNGAAFVVGETSSKDFPVTPGAFMEHTMASGGTGFVTKVSPDGTKLEYSTFLGGSGADAVFQPAVDTDGNVYVAGRTSSSDFPTTPGAFQRKKKSKITGFVAKFSQSGTLVYSTLIGGKNSHEIGWIAVNDAGEAYVTGSTNSTDFPTTPGSYQERLAGRFDSFVTKFDAQGHSLLFSTFLGGAADDSAMSVALDHDGNVYVTGNSESHDYPVTPDAFQTVKRGPSDVVVSKLNPDGSKLVYSTYLGGESDETGYAIAVDNSGNAVVAGETFSAGFPTTSDAILAQTSALPTGFLSVIEPSDFILSLTPQQITLPTGGKGTVEVGFERKGGMVGPVKITAPNAAAFNVKVSPHERNVTSSRNASFRIEVKQDAAIGQYPLIFSAADERGVIRHTATFMLIIQ